MTVGLGERAGEETSRGPGVVAQRLGGNERARGLVTHSTTVTATVRQRTPAHIRE
jgi:hypothetical protein